MTPLQDRKAAARSALHRFSRSTTTTLLGVVIVGYVALGVSSSGTFFEGPSSVRSCSTSPHRSSSGWPRWLP